MIVHSNIILGMTFDETRLNTESAFWKAGLITIFVILHATSSDGVKRLDFRSLPRYNVAKVFKLANQECFLII